MIPLWIFLFLLLILFDTDHQSNFPLHTHQFEVDEWGNKGYTVRRTVCSLDSKSCIGQWSWLDPSSLYDLLLDCLFSIGSFENGQHNGSQLLSRFDTLTYI
jgi:hypothetical protein